MAMVQPTARASWRALLSGAAALLLLLRAVLAIAADVPTALGGESSVVRCAADAGGAPGPRHAPGDRHCAFCLCDERQRLLDSAAAPGVVAASEPPAADAMRPSADRSGASLRAHGWIGSWSSRAPPRA